MCINNNVYVYIFIIVIKLIQLQSENEKLIDMRRKAEILKVKTVLLYYLEMSVVGSRNTTHSYISLISN